MKRNFPDRRKSYYIRKEFQRNFILKFCSLVVIGAVISTVIIYTMSTATVTTAFNNSRLTIKTTADYILPAVLFSSAVMVVLVGVAAIVITLLASHKIAGALHAIDKRIDEIMAGNLKTEFHLRKGDQLKSLATGLNVMVANLRAGISDIKEAVSELEAAIGDHRDADASSGIKDKLEKLKSKAGVFKT